MFSATLPIYENFKALQGDQTEIHLEIGFRRETCDLHRAVSYVSKTYKKQN